MKELEEALQDAIDDMGFDNVDVMKYALKEHGLQITTIPETSDGKKLLPFTIPSQALFRFADGTNTINFVRCSALSEVLVTIGTRTEHADIELRYVLSVEEQQALLAWLKSYEFGK